MAKGRKVRASRAEQGKVEFSHFPPAVHFDLIRKQAVVIPALDRKSGSAGMPRPISYAVFCLKKKKRKHTRKTAHRRKAVHARSGATIRLFGSVAVAPTVAA